MSKKFIFVLVAVFAVVISLGTVAGFLIASQNGNQQTADSLISGNSNVKLNTRAGTALNCGQLDSNNDGLINITDFSAMANYFGRNCVKQAVPTTGCGLMDGDLNGKIDNADVNFLVRKFGKFCNSSEFADCGAMDFDNNNLLNISDFSTLATKYKKICRVVDASPKCGSIDSNLDGVVNQVDLLSLKSRFGKIGCEVAKTSTPGVICGDLDADENGVINTADYDVLIQFVGNKCSDFKETFVNGSKDINGDGMIDQKDLDLFLQRY